MSDTSDSQQISNLRSQLNQSGAKEMEIKDPPQSGLSVTTPVLMVLGTIAVACGVVGTIVSLHASLVAAFFCLTVFGGSGAALLLMSSRIDADETGIVVSRLLSAGRAEWVAITGVEYGGGNLVIRLAQKKRVVMPGPEFWYGAGKAPLLKLMDQKLAEQGVQMKPTFRAILQAGDRH